MTNNGDIEVEKDKNTISFTIPLHITFNEEINTLYLFKISSSEEKTISYSITYKNKLKNKSQIKDSIHFLSKKGDTK